MSPRDVIARALLLADDGGNADAILAATEHAGDCPFVAVPAAYTCSMCQADEYRGKADVALAAIEASLRPFLDRAKEAVAMADKHNWWGKDRLILIQGFTPEEWRGLLAARPPGPTP